MFDLPVVKLFWCSSGPDSIVGAEVLTRPII